MNLLSLLPCHLQPLLQNLWEKNCDLLSICREINPCDLNNHQKQVLMLWITKCWSSSMHSNSSHRFSAGGFVVVKDVLEFVDEVNLQEEFSQVLLLLPESRKRCLISQLSNYLMTSPRRHVKLRHYLLQASVDHVHHFMRRIRFVDQSMISIFANNLENILNCTLLQCSITSNIARDLHYQKDGFSTTNVCISQEKSYSEIDNSHKNSLNQPCLIIENLLMLLDCLLPTISKSDENWPWLLELNKYGRSAVKGERTNLTQNENLFSSSILATEADRFFVRQLGNRCKQILATQQNPVILNQNRTIRQCEVDETEGEKHSAKLVFRSISWCTNLLTILSRVCAMLTSDEIDVDIGNEELIVDVAMKLKCFLEESFLRQFCSNNSSSSSYITSETEDYEAIIDKLHIYGKHLLKIMKMNFADNDLIVYICDDASTASDIKDFHQSGKYQNILLSIWESEKNKEKKLSYAILILENCFHGHQLVFEWLLGHCNLATRSQVNIFVRALNAYITTFGSIVHCTRLVEKLFNTAKNDGGPKDELTKSAHVEVLFLCIESMSTKLMNTLFTKCTTYLESEKPLFWSVHYMPGRYRQELNECLNKMTEISNEEETKKLMTLVFVSPHEALFQMFLRVGKGQLTGTVVSKFLITVPSLLTIQFRNACGEREDILSLLRECYLSNGDEKHAEDLLKIAVNLCKCGDEELRKSTVMTIIDDFIFPSLTGCEACIEFSSAMDILESLLSECRRAQVRIPFSHVTLLLEVLVSFIDPDRTKLMKDFNVLNLYEQLHKSVEDLVSILHELWMNNSGQMEKDDCRIFVKQLLDENDWTIQIIFLGIFLPPAHDKKEEENALTGYEQKMPACLLDYLSVDGTFRANWNPITVKRYEDDTNSTWRALFELFVMSREFGVSLIHALPTTLIDDVMENIVDAVVKIFQSWSVNKFMASSILHCLKNLVQNKKIKNVETYFPENLQQETSVHGDSFGILILMQCFTIILDDVSCNELSDIDRSNLQTIPKILNLYIFLIKELNDNVKLQLSIGVFVFELVLYGISSFDDIIIEYFSLFLTDLLAVIFKCLRANIDGSSKSIDSIGKLKQIITEMCDSNSLTRLKDQFNSFLLQKE